MFELRRNVEKCGEMSFFSYLFTFNLIPDFRFYLQTFFGIQKWTQNTTILFKTLKIDLLSVGHIFIGFKKSIYHMKLNSSVTFLEFIFHSFTLSTNRSKFS